MYGLYHQVPSRRHSRGPSVKGSLTSSVTLSARLDQHDPSAEATTQGISLAASLAEAYMAFWTLAEREPLEKFGMVYRHIVRLESATDSRVAWRTLRKSATAYYAGSGICPFCRVRGPLHLPAEEPTLELREI